MLAFILMRSYGVLTSVFCWVFFQKQTVSRYSKQVFALSVDRFDLLV